MSGYDLTQLLPALEELWHQNPEQAEATARHYIYDANRQHFPITAVCIEEAMKNLKEGKGVDALGDLADATPDEGD